MKLMWDFVVVVMGKIDWNDELSEIGLEVLIGMCEVEDLL